MKYVVPAAFLLSALLLSGCEEPCEYVCSSPDELVGEWRGGSISWTFENTLTFHPGDEYTFVPAADDLDTVGNWSANSETVTLTRDVGPCDRERSTRRYYIEDDKLYMPAYIAVGSRTGLVGRWRRVVAFQTFGCSGEDPVVEWNGTVKLLEDGTGTYDDKQPDGTEVYEEFTWEQQDDVVVFQYEPDPTTGSRPPRPMYVVDGLLSDFRYTRVD